MNNKVKFLRGTSGEYAVAEKDSDTIYFTTDDGKLYIGDKEISGSDITIDDTLSDTSTNPVQNKVVKQAIDNKADKTTATKDTDGLMSAEDKTKLDDAGNTYALKSKYGDTTINVGRKSGTTVGAYSTAEGWSTVAKGEASHAEGFATIVNGDNSHTEGCRSTANGAASHAECLNTYANGDYSHAEGEYTTASGRASHAEGIKTVANNTAEHACGQYNKSNVDTLFSIGDGTYDTARHNAFEITKTGGKLHDKDIATTNQIINSNLLINPDFKVNQRGNSNYVTLGGTGSFVYTVDRWAIDDGGDVTVNSDGTLTVKGTISQILENAVGDNVIVSLGVVSGTATASYDNATKKFSITGENAVISWAKLEYGSIATPFVAPDPALEKEKCQRYYYRITNQSSTAPQVLALAQSMDSAEMNFTINLPTAMRIPPTVTLANKSWLSYSKGMLSSTTAVTNFMRNGCMKPYNAVTVKCSGTFTSGSGYVIFIEPNGCIEFDAEM